MILCPVHPTGPWIYRSELSTIYLMGYRRTRIVINKPFQYRFVFYLCSWVLVLSLIYPTLVSGIYDSIIMSFKAEPLLQKFVPQVQQIQERVLVWLVILQALFIGLIGLIGLFVSHRIAGPLYKLKLFFAEAQKGNLRTDLSFRKGDHFMDLANEFNVTMAAIKSMYGDPTPGTAKPLSDLLLEVEAQIVQLAEEDRDEFGKHLTRLKELA
jgi:methyl-accepting chemotaxis protein